MKVFFLILAIITFNKIIYANEIGSYNVELPKNLDHVDILINEINSVKPPLKTRGSGQVIFQNVAPSTVIVHADEGQGSGFLIDDNGLIVTNYHVIEKEDLTYSQKIKIAFCPIDISNMKNATVYEATVFKIDPTKDLAIFIMNSPINNSTNKVVPMVQDKSNILVGMDVHAIGSPGKGINCSYTRGYISQQIDNYEWKYPNSEEVKSADIIQTQTPINPGNSGGPLINNDGQVVGVNSFKSSAVGINFAVSINEVIDLVQNGPVVELQPETVCEKTLIRTLDKNKNGVDDIFTYDRDCNGIEDRLEYDEDEDGKTDQILLDSNENGIYEYRIIFGVHTEGKLIGKNLAIWYIDEDENEEFEKRCIDDDYDGNHDRCKSLI